MKINRYKLLILLISIIAFSCNSLDEVYDELEIEEQDGIEGLSLELNLNYTLTSDDYDSFESKTDEDSLVAINGMFMSEDQADRLIPEVLLSEFEYAGAGSSALVEYEIDGGLSDISDFVYAEELYVGGEELESVDASASAAGFLSPSYDLEGSLETILNSEVQDPTDGDMYAVVYGYADTDPIVDLDAAGLNTIYTELFTDDIDAFTAVSLLNDDLVWEYNQYFNGCAIMSAYSGGPEEVSDWLISPSIDLSGVTESELRFHQVINYLGSGIDPADVLGVKVSSDFDGSNVSSATWTDLLVDAWPAGNSWSEEVWSTMDISDFDGMPSVHIAFVYDNTTVLDDPSWEVGEVIVEGLTSATVTILEEPSNLTTYFSYSGGSWNIEDEGVYSLIASDYDGMGEDGPGRFDNFSSSYDPDVYLPIFLASTFPFASEEDEIVVMYKYYDGSTNIRGDLYTYLSGEWLVTSVTKNFGFDGTVWVPDNTVKYTFAAADWSWVGEEYAEANAAGSESVLQYSNFDTQLWSSEQIFLAITERLKIIFPDSEEGQKYLVTYDTWEPGNSTRELYVILEGIEYVVYETE